MKKQCTYSKNLCKHENRSDFYCINLDKFHIDNCQFFIAKIHSISTNYSENEQLRVLWYIHIKNEGFCI